MKLKRLSAFVLVGVAMVSQQAFAADGTITFTGKIQASTCTINSGTPNFSVTLPTVSTGTLNTATTAGRTAFQISLSGCTGVTSVHTFFEAGPATDAATGRLNNTIASTSGGATNVQIQLLNEDASVIKAGFTDSATQQNSKPVTLAAGATAATLTYYAEYFATGTAGVGDVSSNVAYTIVYN